jgi:hypothetical protein
MIGFTAKWQKWNGNPILYRRSKALMLADEDEIKALKKEGIYITD